VWLLDAQHHERLGHMVRQLGLVVKVELFEALQDVIETAQTGAPLLVPALQHGESLLGETLHQAMGNFGRSLELQPVSRALQNLEFVVTAHVLGRPLSLQATEGGVMVSP